MACRSVNFQNKRDGLWSYVPLMHPSAIGISYKKGYIEQGAERATYEMTEVTDNNVPVGQKLVGKISIHEEPSQIEFHKLCAFVQFEAGRLARKFNTTLEELEGIHKTSITHIDFLEPCYYEYYTQEANGGGVGALLCEKRLDSTRFKKWNDNKGGVFNLNKDLGDLKATLAAIEDDEDEDQEEDEINSEQQLSTAMASAYMARIIDEDVPQAFSHWTHVYTKRDSLVCDLQGVVGNRFEMTDPAIHSSRRKFGATDHGRVGQRCFFETHKCNPLCRILRLDTRVYLQQQSRTVAFNYRAGDSKGP